MSATFIMFKCNLAFICLLLLLTSCATTGGPSQISIDAEKTCGERAPLVEKIMNLKKADRFPEQACDFTRGLC